MEKRFFYFLEKTASLENILLFGGLLLIMVFVILPEAEKGMEQWSGGIGILKNGWFLTPGEMYAEMGSYGQKGRETYIFILLTADLFYIFSYTFFFLFLMTFIAKPFDFPHKSKLVLFPFFIGIFGLLENGFFVFLLNQFPAEYPLLTRVAALFALVKWIALSLVVLLVCFGLGYFGKQFFELLKIKKNKDY